MNLAQKKACPKASREFLFWLYRDFGAVAENECHRAVSDDRHSVDDRKPQGFVPLGEDERSLLDVADEYVKRLGLGEPFLFRRFQFVNPLRRLAVAFQVAVVALVEVALVLSGSGVLADCLARKFGDNLNLTTQFGELGINRSGVAER